MPIEYRYTIPSLFYVNEPTIQENLERFFAGWTQPTQIPMPDINRLQYLYESLIFNNSSFEIDVAPFSTFGWELQPQSQPILPVEYRHLIPDLFLPSWEEIISTPDLVNFAAWVQPLSEPVLPIEYRYLLPSYFGQTLLSTLFVAAGVAPFFLRTQDISEVFDDSSAEVIFRTEDINTTFDDTQGDR